MANLVEMAEQFLEQRRRSAQATTRTTPVATDPDADCVAPAQSDVETRSVPQFPALATPETPLSPILPGWLVVYRGADGRLCGGDDDRAHGTVARSEHGPSGWTFTLTDGHALPMRAIRGVTKTAPDGRVLAGWTVLEHGLDGGLLDER